MKYLFKKQTLIKTFTLILFLLMFVFNSPNSVLAQSREELDDQADQEEIDKLKELQREDEILCEENANGDFGGFGGVYVPVQEQGGPLLSSSQTIKNLSVEICTYTKAIKRIQQAMEKQTFALEPKIRRDAATASEKYRLDTLGEDGLITKGYDTDGSVGPNGEEAPLNVTNLEDHTNTVVKEAENVYILKDLKNSNDVYKDNTAQTLLKENVDKNSTIIPDSTVSIDDYEAFRKGETPISSFWSTFLAVSDPNKPNNPNTSYLINTRLMKQKADEAEQNSREEISAAGGYLPVRECTEQITKDYLGNELNPPICAKWKIITPASQIKNINEDVLANELNRYLNAKPGDLAPGNEPDVQEVIKNEINKDDGGGGVGGADLNLTNIIDIILNIFQNIQNII